MLDWLLGNRKANRRKQLREQMERAFTKRLHAKYDAARDTLENAKHWSAADYLGPNAAMREDIRRKVRAAPATRPMRATRIARASSPPKPTTVSAKAPACRC